MYLIVTFSEYYDLYGADEFGTVTGVHDMKAEIYARGPIACLLNSDAEPFDNYHGGVIKCDEGPICKIPHYADHVIVIAGWGVDVDGTEYWVGRNSYGTQV
jgi:cathepsin X